MGILIGFHYGTTISKNEVAISAYTSEENHNKNTTRAITQINVTTSLRLPPLKPASSIQSLKNTIREQTKELTSHIQHYCSTKKFPGPSKHFTFPKRQLYFDFAHNFMYCRDLKVNLVD